MILTCATTAINGESTTRVVCNASCVSFQEKLVHHCSALWDGWLAVAEREQAFRVEGFDASCSSLWYQKLAEYLASWKPPVGLAPDALEAINTCRGHWLEKFFCPEGWFATVEGIESHIKLKVNQETAFWKDWENPENDTLYITLDGQEPNVIFVQSVRPAHRWRNALYILAFGHLHRWSDTFDSNINS